MSLLLSKGGRAMPLIIVRDDITKVHADAIVNATDSLFSGGGGSDKAIHLAAGPGMRQECNALGGCEVGQAKLTEAYNLNARYVIHTVGPIWFGGGMGEEKLLADCYRNSLAIAKKNNLESIAFPVISSGTFEYPKGMALKIANSVIVDFLLKNDMNVYLVVYDKETLKVSEKLFSSVKQYIDENYVEYGDNEHYSLRRSECKTNPILQETDFLKTYSSSMEKNVSQGRKKRSLDDVVGHLDETFSQTLLRMIDERNMKDCDVYHRANIDRKLFSKIRGNIGYNPSKPTAIAFAIALSLNIDETKDLLLRAGFALSSSSMFDVIIQYFIEDGNCNIFEINETLFYFGQKTF
jgi:O-acetyl-ADP-ribose deacetylase (regulator of RNase III)